MARGTEIIGRIFIENSDTGETKAWEDLTQEEIQQFRKKSCERLGKSLSRYFSQYPEEYEKL